MIVTPRPLPTPSIFVYFARVQITDIVVGDGGVAEVGKGVTLKWVMRRMNGYYVSSSAEGEGEPFIYRVSGQSMSRPYVKAGRASRDEGCGDLGEELLTRYPHSLHSRVAFTPHSRICRVVVS